MQSMVEKVARAIALEDLDPETRAAVDPDRWFVAESYYDLARAAIEAMREPTPEMLVSEDIHFGYSCNTCGGLKDGWETMIDAALKEPA